MGCVFCFVVRDTTPVAGKIGCVECVHLLCLARGWRVLGVQRPAFYVYVVLAGLADRCW